jgi:hypothetical protein
LSTVERDTLVRRGDELQLSCSPLSLLLSRDESLEQSGMIASKVDEYMRNSRFLQDLERRQESRGQLKSAARYANAHVKEDGGGRRRHLEVDMTLWPC